MLQELKRVARRYTGFVVRWANGAFAQMAGALAAPPDDAMMLSSMQQHARGDILGVSGSSAQVGKHSVEEWRYT